MLDFTVPVLFVLAIGGIALAIRYWPRSIEQEIQHHYERFMWERRGVSFEDRQGELALRTAAARLRRRTTEAVIRQPKRWMEIIDRIAGEEAVALAAHDRQIAKQFHEWVMSASTDEILYEPAMKLVWQQVKDNADDTKRRLKAPSPTELQDQLAALKVSG